MSGVAGVVNAATDPTFTVSETGTLVFDSLPQGYMVDAPDTTEDARGIQQSVTLTKVGTGAITNLSVSISGGTSTKFVVGTVNPDALGEGTLSTVLNIHPKYNLGVGTHIETVTLTADGGISHSFDVSFTVNAVPTTFTVSETGTLTIDALSEGYTNSDSLAVAEAVTLTKAGPGAITNLSASISGGTGTKFLVGTVNSDSLGAGVSSAVFNIRPKNNLGPGTYTETVTLTADGGISHSFDVSFTVNAVPTTFTVSETGTLTINALSEGYTNSDSVAAAEGVTLTKVGPSAITNLSASISGGASTKFLVGTVNSDTLGAGVSSAVFNIRPKNNLGPGTYTETVTLTADGGISHSFDVSFTVIAATYTISPLSNQSATALKEGYESGTQETKTVAITRTGTGKLTNLAVALSGADADAFHVTQPPTSTLDGSLSDTAFTLSAKDGLAAGTYTATVTVSADNMTDETFTITQLVQLPDAPVSPQNLSASEGDRVVQLSWDTVTGATYYNVYQSETTGVYDGIALATVTGSTYSVQNLANGKRYYFVVKAGNSGGLSAESNEVSAMPVGVPAAHVEDDSSGFAILVNGKTQNIGKATITHANGQQTTVIALDEEKLRQRLESEGEGALITIPVLNDSDVVIGEFNGRMMKSMENQQAIIEILTEKATYTLPAEQMNMNSIMERFGPDLDLQDITIRIELAEPQADIAQMVEAAANRDGLQLVVPPLVFKVTVVNGEHVEEISRFNAYIERMVAIPEDIDPDQITTGVVVEQDGTVRHVPTKVVEVDGRFYAQINSLTNSTYSVVWHPVTFNDVAEHWARAAVNDMGSRLVISGFESGDFKPDQDITRAEFAAIMVRGLGLKLESGASPFRDVSSEAWYANAVQTAYEYGLISGFEDGTFRPEARITREQAMVILAGAMKLTLPQSTESASSGAGRILDRFADREAVSSWARSGVENSVQAGIVSGRDIDLLAPQATVTRAEVAMMVQRLLQKSGLI